MTTYQRISPQYLSDQDLMTVSLSETEWQSLYEAVAFSEDGKGIAERIQSEIIQPERLSWEMTFTIQEWAFLADRSGDSKHLEQAVAKIDDLLQQNGWYL